MGSIHHPLCQRHRGTAGARLRVMRGRTDVTQALGCRFLVCNERNVPCPQRLQGSDKGEQNTYATCNPHPETRPAHPFMAVRRPCKYDRRVRAIVGAHAHGHRDPGRLDQEPAARNPLCKRDGCKHRESLVTQGAALIDEKAGFGSKPETGFCLPARRSTDGGRIHPMISESELVRCRSVCVPEEKANAAPSGSSLGA